MCVRAAWRNQRNWILHITLFYNYLCPSLIFKFIQYAKLNVALKWTSLVAIFTIVNKTLLHAKMSTHAYGERLYLAANLVRQIPAVSVCCLVLWCLFFCLPPLIESLYLETQRGEFLTLYSFSFSFLSLEVGAWNGWEYLEMPYPYWQ